MKLTDYLAIYGALLSTAVFFWNAAKARPRIRVRLAIAVETSGGTTRGGLGVSIQNPSAHSVHLTAVSFLYPFYAPTLRQRLVHVARFKRIPLGIGWCYSSFSLHGIEDGCPVSIEPRASHYIFVPQEAVEAILAKVTCSPKLYQS